MRVREFAHANKVERLTSCIQKYRSVAIETVTMRNGQRCARMSFILYDVHRPSSRN